MAVMMSTEQTIAMLGILAAFIAVMFWLISALFTPDSAAAELAILATPAECDDPEPTVRFVVAYARVTTSRSAVVRHRAGAR